jgi:phage virion morphogenesis protein
MVGVSIRIEGDMEVGNKLAAAAARLASPRDLWARIGLALLNSTKVRFEQEQDPDGNPWPKSIRVLTQGGKTLNNSGHLTGSLAFEANDDGVAVGTNAIYAAVHQFGATITAKSSTGLMFRIGDRWIRKQSVDIPRRAFLGLSDDDEVQILDIAGAFVTEPLGGADAR